MGLRLFILDLFLCDYIDLSSVKWKIKIIVRREIIMSIVVFGGVGYIGLYVVDELIICGYEVVVIDNLRIGYKEFIYIKVKFYEGDIWDKVFLSLVFEKEKVDGVIYFVVSLFVGELMEVLFVYLNNNVYGM